MMTFKEFSFISIIVYTDLKHSLAHSHHCVVKESGREKESKRNLVVNETKHSLKS